MNARLFFQVFTIEARKMLTYRFEFWVNLFMHLAVSIGVPYCLWCAIYAHAETEVIRGYTFQAMVIYYVFVALITRLVRGPDFVYDVSNDIYEGGLSRYLLYPANYFMFKYAQHIGSLFPYLVQIALFGAPLLLWFGLPADIHITVASAGGALVAVLLANLLYYVLTLPLQTVSFWAGNVWSLIVMQQIVAQLLGGAMVPLDLFPDWIEPAIRCLPYAALYDLPVNTLLGKVSVAEWARGIALALAWLAVISLLSRSLWRRGLHTYTGVGI